jgi:carboxymethylenebutenolidase
MDRDSGGSLTENEITRREFVAAALAAGLALAVAPASAQTIATDSTGLVAGDVKVPAGDGDIPAYRAMPASGHPFPVVLVVHEIFGVHEHIKDICRRFAKAGHLAIAPDLYARQGDVSKIPNFNDIFKVVTKVPDSQVMSDLDAAVAWAAKNQGDAQRVGITGFCWGGRVVWMYADHNPKIKAGVAWYGPVVGQASPLQPKHPVDIAPSLKVPVLGLYAGKDAMIRPDTVERMRDLLKKAGSPSEIIVYPEADHGFFADYRPGYRKEDAQDGWRRLQEWFKRHGAA